MMVAMTPQSPGPSVPHRAPAAALWLVVGLVVILGFTVLSQLASRQLHAETTEWYAVAMLAAGLVSYTGAGCLLLWRRPSNSLGTKLILTGVALLALAFQGRGLVPLAVVGAIFQGLPYALLIHLLLSFPSGRLTSRAARILVAAAYVTWLPIQGWATYLFDPRASPGGILMIADNRELFLLGDEVLWIVWPLIVLATMGMLIARIVTSPGPGALLWVYGYCAAMLAIVLVGALLDVFDVVDRRVLELWFLLLLCGVPIAFVLAMLRGAFAKTTELHELGAWLARHETDGPLLTQMLVRVLDDPTLRLAYWMPAPGGYVDAAGRPVTPRPDAVEVTVGERRVGVIDYDGDRVTDPALVRAAANIVALAMDHERLTAQLRASRTALQLSRSRIVEAADRERGRIARDLHDRMQSRLITLGLTAGALEHADPSAAQLRTGLEDAAAELRRIVYNIMPPGLVERGLAAAVADLADRQPIPVTLEVASTLGELPEQVQYTAYLVMAESLTNAVKHADARAVGVRLTRERATLVCEVRDDGKGGAVIGSGLGLAGIADRVDALGGRLHLESPHGGGTLVRVELPCPPVGSAP